MATSAIAPKRQRRQGIDRQVKLLVRTLNALPGIQTFSSCGGHKKPDASRSQAADGEFFVNFWLDPGERGYLSLRAISCAVGAAGYYYACLVKNEDSEMSDDELVACASDAALLRVWFNGDDDPDDGDVAYEISGLVDPDLVAWLMHKYASS